MRIEITDLGLREVLNILKEHQDGVVEVENDRAYWNYVMKGSKTHAVNTIQKPAIKRIQIIPQQVAKQAAPDAIGKMRDSLFEAFGA